MCVGVCGLPILWLRCAVGGADFDLVLNVNLRGIFLCAKAVLPLMLANNYGRIVNIASVAG